MRARKLIKRFGAVYFSLKGRSDFYKHDRGLTYRYKGTWSQTKEMISKKEFLDAGWKIITQEQAQQLQKIHP